MARAFCKRRLSSDCGHAPLLAAGPQALELCSLPRVATRSPQPTPPPTPLTPWPAVVRNNSVMAVGAAAVGATGKASFQLAERTVVAGNRAALWGALAVGGDGTLEVQLASGASVTDNVVGQVGAAAPGALLAANSCC